MNIIIKKSNSNDNLQPKVFDLGVIELDLQTLLDNTTIEILDNQPIILSVINSDGDFYKYLLPLSNIKGAGIYGYGKNITTDDLVLLSTSVIQGIRSISGNLVNNSDPKNPVIELPYYEYRSLLNHNSASNGTILSNSTTGNNSVKILNNDLGNIIITKVSTGRIEFTSTNLFIDDKTSFSISTSNDKFTYKTYNIALNKIVLLFSDKLTDLPSDSGSLQNCEVIIKVIK